MEGGRLEVPEDRQGATQSYGSQGSSSLQMWGSRSSGRMDKGSGLGGRRGFVLGDRENSGLGGKGSLIVEGMES